MSNKPMLDTNRQKKNKNHLKPISGQGSALRERVSHRRDFLAEPKAAKKAFPLIKVQEDLTACLIEGSSIVFKFYYEAEIEGTLPNNGKIITQINIADIVGALTMKGLVLPRLIDKDSYDIYAISGFYGGNPNKASESYANHVKKAKLTVREKSIIQFSMSRINQAFRSIDSYGVFAVSRFAGTNVDSDVYLRVSTFLKNVSSVLFANNAH